MVIADLHVEALPAAYLARIRSRGTDDFGNPLAATVVDEQGGTPLRCCLREATIGEKVTLIAYQPARVGGPYAEVGPIFVHADTCDGYRETNRYPDGFRHRRQLLRAYSGEGRIVDATVAENGDQAEQICATYFQRSEIAYIHSRNLLWGCYMFTIRRAEPPR